MKVNWSFFGWWCFPSSSVWAMVFSPFPPSRVGVFFLLLRLGGGAFLLLRLQGGARGGVTVDFVDNLTPKIDEIM